MSDNKINRREWLKAAGAGAMLALPGVFAAGLRNTSIAGQVALVLKDNQVLDERGYGITDLSSCHKVDAHTNFPLASLTKQLTAMATMLLEHDGQLRYTIA